MENQETISTVINTSQDMSPEIGKLIEALSAAQGEMKPASKDAANPYFKSKYADLASVWEVIRGPLSKNKLAVIQTTSNVGVDITIITLLAHQSGQWVKGTLTLRPAKADAQGIGSVITYGRRYALASICGVAPEDDDGNAASRPVEQNNKLISAAQAETIKNKIAATKTDTSKFCSAYKIDCPESLPAAQYQSAIELLTKKETSNGTH